MSENKMDYTFMYWFTRLNHIRDLAEAGVVFNIVALIAAAMCWGISHDFDPNNQIERSTYLFLRKIGASGKLALASLLLCMGIQALVPTQKEAAAIYLIPKIVNNTRVTSVVEDSASIVQLKLKEYLDNLTKEVKAQNEK